MLAAKTEDFQGSQVEEGAAPSAAADAPAALPVADFFFANFFAAAFASAFLTAGFFFVAAGTTILRVTFFATAAGFFAVGAAAFLAADFFFATGALTVASSALIPRLSTKNASRFFAPTIHAGARPTPDQVLPVFGSAYFATPPTARLGFTFFAVLGLLTATLA